MGRSILSGSVLGAVLSALILSATSLMLPLAPAPAPAPGVPDAAVPAPSPLVEMPAPILELPAAAAEPDPADAVAALPVPEATVAIREPDAPTASALVTPAPTRSTGPAIVEVPAGSEFARAPGDALALRPAIELAPTVATAPAAPLALPDAAPAPAATDPGTPPAAPTGPTAPGALSPEVEHPTLPQAEQPLPVPPPGEALAPTLPAVARTDQPAVPDILVPPAAPGAAMPAPEADAAPETAPAQLATTPPPQTAALPDIILVPDAAPAAPAAPAAAPVPQPGFAGVAAAPGFVNAPGVAVNRLPSIGVESVPVAEPLAPRQSPLEAFRAEFTGSGAPLLALVLLDPTAEGDFAALRALGLPLTIAIDPMRADAAADAQKFRAAGFEVAILAARLPVGATPGDLEVALAAWRRVLPEAVAVVEPPQPVMQGNRSLAQQLVAALAREGLGLATHSGKGLNAAAQLATAAGLPQVLVWRVLDTEGDTAPAIRRYLDRAAFEASRGVGVAVMLHAWPESLAGLAEWQKRREGGPDLAPLSALALAGGAL